VTTTSRRPTPGSGCRTRSVLASTLVVLVLSTAAACSIVRSTRGSPLRAVPAEHLVLGETTKADVLRIFGPPTGIVRQFDGALFVYSRAKRHKDTLRLEEPVFTGIEVFSYTRSDTREDRLVVQFDAEGVVRSFGYAEGTLELGGLP